MAVIQNIVAREILDSRGHPTIQSDVILSDGSLGRASVPSGASTGIHEALELRDTKKQRYQGMGVLKAVQNVKHKIAPVLIGKSIENQSEIDALLIQLDGTKNKSKLGANAILSVSLAVAQARACTHHLPLYQELGGETATLLPVPMMNILNGGKHANNGLDVQEFMIVPFGGKNFSESLQMGAEIFYALKSILKKKNLNINVGDEGGFAPHLFSTTQALDFILEAIENSPYRIGKEVGLALDIAASTFYRQGHYFFEKEILSADEMIDKYQTLCCRYPIVSLEDALAEDDWFGWTKLTQQMGKKVQLVGDDLFVTNAERLQRGICEQTANAILIKPNQIGTLTETMDTIKLAQENGYRTIISHRSGETEDTFIADLAVATNAGQIKTGSLSRTDRVAKYNRLLQIEEELGKRARFYEKKLFLR